MKHQKIKISERTVTGNSVRKLRSQGILPAVIYGKDFEPKSVELSTSDFVKVYKEVGMTTVVELELGKENIPVLIHAIDLHPVTDRVRHADFLAVDLKKKVHAEVPLKLLNKESVEKNLGALVNVSVESLSVEALPDSIPHEIEIDLSVLESVSDSIKVSDVDTRSGFIVLNDPEETLVTILEVRTSTADEEGSTSSDAAVTDTAPSEENKDN